MIRQDINLILVDLDGTLIKSNKANNRAYAKAINDLYPEFVIPKIERITEEHINTLFSDELMAEKIIAKKADYNALYLSDTLENKLLLKILFTLSEKCEIHLVTQACRKRAIPLLIHHNLLSLFDNFIFCKGITNKYAHATEEFKISPKHTLIFEDSATQIKLARCLGYPKNNLIKTNME